LRPWLLGLWPCSRWRTPNFTHHRPHTGKHRKASQNPSSFSLQSFPYARRAACSTPSIISSLSARLAAPFSSRPPTSFCSSTSTCSVLVDSASIAMVVLGSIQLVNPVNCPTCGYNNISGKTHCEGKKSDGSPCGTSLPVVV
jgi:hypothetical protein